jgi:hypothetical protein
VTNRFSAHRFSAAANVQWLSGSRRAFQGERKELSVRENQEKPIDTPQIPGV